MRGDTGSVGGREVDTPQENRWSPVDDDDVRFAFQKEKPTGSCDRWTRLRKAEKNEWLLEKPDVTYFAGAVYGEQHRSMGWL